MKKKLNNSNELLMMYLQKYTHRKRLVKTTVYKTHLGTSMIKKSLKELSKVNIIKTSNINMENKENEIIHNMIDSQNSTSNLFDNLTESFVYNNIHDTYSNNFIQSDENNKNDEFLQFENINNDAFSM